MTTGAVGLQGAAPKVGVTNVEKAKYEKLWKKFPQYRKVSPGENISKYFLERVNPPKGSRIIDFGCGTGRGGLALHEAGMEVLMSDFVGGCLDKKVRKAMRKSDGKFSFIEHDLNSRFPEYSVYGYCADVLEHVPENQTDVVIQNILEVCRSCFFMIHTQEDRCGKLIDETLHVNQQDYAYWVKKFADNDCTITWSEQLGHSVLFYVTAWTSKERYPWCELINTTADQVADNIRENSKLDFPSIMPHERQDTEVMLVGGGPSLLDFKDEIIEQREAGMPLITTNGAYNLMIRWGLKPSLQMIIDSRPFNKKFLTPLVDDCKYFIASSADPSLFEGMPKDRTFFWHVALSEEILPVIRECFGKEHDNWWATPGGSTVMLRAMCVLPFIGYRKMHIYGMDSCLNAGSASRDGNSHHAYAQPENEHKNILPLVVSSEYSDEPPRMFQCQPWMLSQAAEFRDMCAMLAEHVDLDVKGNGLIGHIIKTGASLSK